MSKQSRPTLATLFAILFLSTPAHAQGRADVRRAVAFTPVAAPAQAGLPPLKEATVFGQKIQYVDVGSGPVVVLLHGSAGTLPTGRSTSRRSLRSTASS